MNYGFIFKIQQNTYTNSKFQWHIFPLGSWLLLLLLCITLQEEVMYILVYKAYCSVLQMIIKGNVKRMLLVVFFFLHTYKEHWYLLNLLV